jgi:hypothetical protein
VQAQFNAWAGEASVAYVQLSRTCAMSIGQNYSTEMLERFVGRSEGERYASPDPLERDDLSSNRHPALSFCLSMIFSESRYTLFRIML